MQRELARGTFCAVLTFWLANVLSAAAGDVQSQEDISKRIAGEKPVEAAFVKERPILGWRLDGDTFEDLPDFVRDALGKVDETAYDATYFAQNRGSIVALQMTSDGPDFYIIGKSTYAGSYVEVPLAEVAEKNRKLVERLHMLPELQARFQNVDPGLVGALKTEPIDMIRMSDIGYPQDAEVTIDSPWGMQTKPAGQDAFLVHDQVKDQYYIVNADDDGLPINYVPAD